MNDWANETAATVLKELLAGADRAERQETVAAALRKAKADGMREAAQWCFVHAKSRDPDFVRLHEHFTSRASAIEKGME